jgi:hypothetical protein
MSRDDGGIRNLLPGIKTMEEIKEDQKAERVVKNLIEQRTQITPGPDPLETLASYIPTTSLDLSSKPVEKTKDTKGFNSQRDYENYLTSRARLKEEDREAREIRAAINTNKIVDQVDKMVKKYDGPSTEKTIGQLKALKKWAQPTPVGLGNKYKSDTRSPNQKKRDAYVEKKRDQARFKYNNTTGTFRNELGQEKGMMDAHRSNEKKTKWPPGAVRFAQDEADHLNGIKKQTYEEGGRVGPKPKYVSAQDIVDLHERSEPKATPLQEKKLHQRLRNHNERTGQFKNLPKEEELHPYEQYHEEKLIEIANKGKSITLPLIDPIFKKSAQPGPTKGARYIPWYERMGNKNE